MSIEVLVPEGDEAKILTQEEARLIIRENNMGATEDNDFTIQTRHLK